MWKLPGIVACRGLICHSPTNATRWQIVPGQLKRRISAQAALLFLATGLQADITLPTQAPPQADAQAARVWRGGQTTIPLRGHHGGGGTVTFWIVRRPEHGKLSGLHLIGDNRAVIAYENDGAESVTSDRFRYAVKTSGGLTSSPAEVRITVEEAPARIVVPGRMEFDEIMAGESESRPLAITNEGGGVLEGRLSVSAPWQLTLTDYRVKSGRTEVVTVSFQPNEGRKFIGQITLTGADGAQTSVQLAGTAIAPVRVEPDHLEIDASNAESGPRVGFVSLTNQTERALRLKLVAGSNIQPIPEVALASHEKKKIPIVVLLHREIPLHEEIALAGAGFKTRLQIDAGAPPVAPAVSSKGPVSPAPSPAVLLSAPSVATPMERQQSNPIAIHSDGSPSSPPPVANGALVAVHAQRADASRWELRWPQPKTPATKYRIEERVLSLDGAGALQTSWRELAPLEIAASGKEVVAQIKGLEPKKLHMLRVTAIGAAGATLWESPVVALAPPREPPRRERHWLLFFGLTLFVFLFLRWRASRAAA